LPDLSNTRENFAKQVTFFQKWHLANVGQSGKTRIFLKKAVSANASTRQKWIFFGECSQIAIAKFARK
jgi:hypothetical protein